jgi:hypothetical protein
MKGLRLRHMLLAFGAALLIAGMFVPWVTPVVYYGYIGVNELGATWFNWGPFDFVWNALTPRSSAAYQFVDANAAALVGASALYILATLAIAAFTYPLIRRDMRQVDVRSMAWPLFSVAGWAGLTTLFGWLIYPTLGEWSEGAALPLRNDMGTYGGPIAFAGAALAFVGLFGIAMNSYNRQLRTSGRMLAAGADDTLGLPPAATDA